MWINQLRAEQAEQVIALAARAAAVDQVDPLNEDARLSLSGAQSRHLLVEESGVVVGYLNHSPRFATAQLVVDPTHRRHGLARAMWAQLPGDHSTGCWAFGALPAAWGFAAAVGLTPQRRLLIMSRRLTDLQPSPAVPGLELRGFTPDDANALLAVNAAAFADHHEQGSLTADDLAQRMSESWFDPTGLILGFDAGGLAGFHWTKADHGVGEVYVVAVAPRAQGRGYGTALLEAGMSHLASKGLPTVLLFVDAADQIAVRMYERAGFTIARQDVFFTPQI